MSLNTILQIGKVLRSSENSLKYFKYVEPCPKDKDGNWPICITIPVNADFTFDWNSMIITPENERNKLYYLNFATSNSDTSPKKYGWGDIFYSRQSKFDRDGNLKSYNEFGNYTFEKGDKKNAFLNGEKVFTEIKELYMIELISPTIEITNEKDREAIIKYSFQQIKRNKEGTVIIAVPKKLSNLTNYIDYFIQKTKEIENSDSLFRFQTNFREELVKFNNILQYAPAIDHVLQERTMPLECLLQDEVKIKEIYRKAILNKEFDRIKKLFQKGEKPEVLSEATKRKIEQFADFKIFIHFDFNDCSWYQFESEFQLIKNKLNSEITDISTIRKGDLSEQKVIVPSKNIFRTLCSGDKKNDFQFPNFDTDNRYKSFTFKDDEEFEDFLHTDRFSLKSPLRKIAGTDIGVYILPVSIENDESITPKEYESFFFDKKDETKLSEPIFSFERDITRFKRFDFIFTDIGGNTENDRIEISGIEKSRFLEIKKRIEEISLKITEEKKQAFGRSDIKNLHIESSFANLLGKAEVEENPKNKKVKVVFKNMTKTSSGLKPVPQYQSHLLKVLPLIYTENYYYNEVLLPELISKVEFSLRSGDEWGNYTLLKFDLKFLLSIQNSKTNKFMEITDSASYQIGTRLGKLSKPLKKKINSFEKKYVGLLTRHISTKDDCIKFTNEINEMLVRHEKTWAQMSAETIEQIVALPNKEYDKEKLALGFFEGYFKYEVADDKNSLLVKIEKLISDYGESENLQNEIQQLRETLEEIK